MKRSDILFLLGFCLTACQQDNAIQTYRVAKEAAPMAAPGPTSMTDPHGMQPLPGMTPAASPKEISWTVPAGWKEQAPSSMRVGSFLVPGKDGRNAEVSVIPLNGMAGGDLANVNRWRDQIELDPLSEAELPGVMQTLKLGANSMKVVDFVSEKRLIDGRIKKRLIAATLPQGERSWFFKLVGDEPTVQSAKPSFIAFLSSVRLNDANSH